MQGIRLDQHTLQIQLAEELLEHSPLMVFARGIAGLSDRHAKGGGVQRDLGNEGRTAAAGRLNGAPQGLAVTHQLVEIRCAAWDLCNGPVTDRSAQFRHIHLQEEVAERGIRWRSPQIKAQRLGENDVVPAGKTFQIPQALAAAQDSEHGHQQQVPSWKPYSPPHPRVRDRLEVADQIEIGCGSSGFRHKAGASPLSSTHADSPDQSTCDTL